MNWAREIALEIIEKRPNEEVYNVACGVSPSGFVHIGNFREIVTPYFVAEALAKLGKKVRFILSVDEFDRFRKVPGNIPAEYAKYIGMPYVDIPSPFSENQSLSWFHSLIGNTRPAFPMKICEVKYECGIDGDGIANSKF